MLRMCEHEDGMRVSDVRRSGQAGILLLTVPEVKDKVRTSRYRTCELLTQPWPLSQRS